MLGWLGTDDARQRLTKVLGQKVAQSLKTAYGVTTVGDLVTKVPSRWLGHDRGLDATAVGPRPARRTAPGGLGLVGPLPASQHLHQHAVGVLEVAGHQIVLSGQPCIDQFEAVVESVFWIHFCTI